MQNLFNDLIFVLKDDDRLVVEGKILKNKVVELALGMDASLLKLLLKSESLKKHFFIEVEGIMAFDKIKFQRFVSNKQFLPDSYTAFKNKIGLTANGEYLTEANEVVLAWPYKDCVLEGGQTKEDQKRNEIFWNTTLAADEIDRLLSPKVLTNFCRFDKDGKSKADDISKNDHLLLKGNNLLVLESLKSVYKGLVKLIYIDPPYNKNGDSFNYNDHFNHSTWLTFMKNRLELARELLRPDGVLAISIDHNEAFHLKVLADEIFGRDQFLSSITVQNNPKGRVMDKNFSTSHEYLLFYSKNHLNEELSVKKSNDEIKKNYPEHDEGGYFRALELRNTHSEFGKHNRPNLFFPLYINPDDASVTLEKSTTHSIAVYPIWDDEFEGCWTWNMTKVKLQGDLLIGKEIKGRWKVYRKSYSTDSSGDNVSKQLKTIWLQKDFQTEKGQKALDGLIGKGKFKAPKPIEYIKTIIDLATKSEDNDIVLDFFAGSGTTGQAVIELNESDNGNRSFILCEQMDYIKAVTIPRLAGVIGSSSFIYAELKNSASAFLEKIEAAKSSNNLMSILNQLQRFGFISYKIPHKSLDGSISDFSKLPLERQKHFILEILEKDCLYIDYCELEDEDNGITNSDKSLNHKFYSLK